MEKDEASAEVGFDPHRPRIDGFVIGRKIGEGGMGVVYEAEQAQPRRRVAIKLVRASWRMDEYGARLFQREIDALARLEHPSIASVYGAGRTVEDQPYLVMELVDGIRLDDWAADLTGDPRRMTRKLGCFIQVCRAVHYAHQRGVIHRDLKPSNVLVSEPPHDATASAPSRAVKILDFGLARLTDAETVSVDASIMRGTLPYMSPEQVAGPPEEHDVRSDVYSLGVILYELITGSRPYDVTGTSPAAALYRIVAEPPRPPRRVCRERGFRLSRDLETIALKALEKERDARYESAAALADDVERYLAKRPIEARPPSALYHTAKLVARHRLASSLVVALIGSVAAFAVYAGLQSRRLAAEVRATERVAEYVVGLFELSNPEADIPGVELPEGRDGASLTAREILDLGRERIRSELDEDPVVRIRLLGALANAYANIGAYEAAAEMLDEATSLTLGDGRSPVAVARVMNDRALLEVRESNYARAQALYERALAILEASPDAAADMTPLVMTNLGELYRLTAQLDRARSTLEEALVLREALHGRSDGRVAATLTALAATYYTAGDVRGGEEAARRALRIREDERPGDVRNEAIREMIGSGYMLEGRYPEADSVYGLVLEARLQDGDPYRLSISRLNLGELYLRMGALDSAAANYEEALALRVGEYGAEHEAVAATRFGLGETRLAQGRLDEAESELLQALDVFERDLGADHPMVGEVLAVYADVLEERGHSERADSLRARAEAIWSTKGRALVR